jgi:hypothetical protein
MGYESVRQTVGNYMTTVYGASGKITAAAVDYPLVGENQPVVPPSTPWLRWGVRPATQNAMDVGGQMKRVTGLLWFQIFLPENTGSRIAHVIADELTTRFFETTLEAGALKCFSAALGYVGPDGSGWDLWRVTIPYWETGP